MLNFLVSVYRANPLRPHCSAAGHVLLCRLLGFNVPRGQDGPRCGGFDGSMQMCKDGNPIPPGKLFPPY